MLKWILALVGFQVGGFFGALLGLFFGSIIDRSINFGVGAINPLSNAKRQESFLKTTFTLMGTMAKADGHISKAEIDQVERFIAQMGMTSGHRQQAIEYFQEGAKPDFNIDAQLQDFITNCGHTLNLTQMLLSYLISVALADGELHKDEESVLRQIALRLGFSEQAFAQLLGMIGAQDHFSSGGTHSKATLEEAYKALGVNPNDSDRDIKRTYRSLMSKYHPDKLIGQGLPEDMIKEATERSQEISAAYDLIVESRKS
jgi:DnaJ like chaperone protein